MLRNDDMQRPSGGFMYRYGWVPWLNMRGRLCRATRFSQPFKSAWFDLRGLESW